MTGIMRIEGNILEIDVTEEEFLTAFESFLASKGWEFEGYTSKLQRTGELQEFQIWSEGYKATGEHGRAMLHNVVIAASFKEACDKLAERDANFKAFYDPERMTYWGCRLYDNSTDARRSHG